MGPLNRRSQKGLSLAETVVASFLLLIGFLVVARLFHSSLRYQVWVDSVSLATSLGEEVAEEVRTWAQDPNNFLNLEAIYGPMTLQREGMEVQILAGAAIPMSTPCNEMELAYANPAERRVLRASYKPLRITVQWSRDVVRLNTLLGDPPREVRAANPVVVVTSSGAMLPKNGYVDCMASIYDTSGAEIPDVFFTWSVEPVTGKGTMVNVTRDGRTAQFQHKTMKPDGTCTNSPGISGLPSQCKVSGGASYRGVEILKLSYALDLAP